MIQDFLTGAACLWRGYRLIAQPRLRRFLYIPLLVNVLVFALLLWLGFTQVQAFLHWLLPDQQDLWADVARVLLWIVFGTTGLIVMFFSFSIVANLIGAPFNGLLAEHVEEQLGGARPPAATGAWSALAGELRKLGYFLPYALLFMVLTFVPIVNLAAPLFWFLFSAWMLALEYLDYPFGNHGLDFRAVRARARQRRTLALGFGSAVALASLVPVVNLAVMPAAVAGATLLVQRHWRDA